MESIFNLAVAWIVSNGLKLILGLILLSIGWKVINKVMERFDKLLEKKAVDSTLKSFLEALASAGLKVALVVFVVLPIVGIPAASFAALVASAGVAIGLALQGSLSNFAGGVVVLLMRPFKVGDFIEVGAYAGSVDRIKIFYTELLTTDNKLILIPNGTLANGSLINYSAKPLRRVDLTFGVSYQEDIMKVKSVLEGIIKAHPLALEEPASFVGLTEYGPSSLNFVVRIWCKTEDYWTVYFEVQEAVKKRFDEEQIQIPYPQMDVHMIQAENK